MQIASIAVVCPVDTSVDMTSSRIHSSRSTTAPQHTITLIAFVSRAEAAAPVVADKEQAKPAAEKAPADDAEAMDEDDAPVLDEVDAENTAEPLNSAPARKKAKKAAKAPVSKDPAAKPAAKPTAKPAAKKQAAAKDADAEAENMPAEVAKPSARAGVGRQATDKIIDYSDQGPKFRAGAKADRVDVKKEIEECDTEKAALEATIPAEKATSAVTNWHRRLLNFIVTDEGGDSLQLQRVNLPGCEAAFFSGALPTLRMLKPVIVVQSTVSLYSQLQCSDWS